MQIGDLVKFKNCSREGETGVVIYANANSAPSCVHLVSYDGDKRMYFTTNQLEVISENR